MMDEMLPFLQMAGITGKQLARAVNCTEPTTFEWIRQLYLNAYYDVKEVYRRHPKSTWQYYEQNKITTLHEVKLLTARLGKLYKSWYENRPPEVNPPKKRQLVREIGPDQKTRKQRKKAPKVTPGLNEPSESDRYGFGGDNSPG